MFADEAIKELFGQQADVFREEAEQALRQEMRDPLGGDAAFLAHTRGDAGEGVSGLLRDIAAAAFGFEKIGISPAFGETLAHRWVGQILEPDFFADRGCAGELGVNLDAQAVADDQQRRVVQRRGVHF